MLEAGLGVAQQVAMGGPLPAPPPTPAGAEAATAPSATAGRPFDDIITKTAQQFGIRPELAHAIIKQESQYNPNAHSPAGAMGLMQLMPNTAQAMGVGNPLDPAENVRGGLRYFKSLLDQFNGNEAAALAAYNAGPGAMSSGRALKIPETQGYVSRILADAGTVAPRAAAAAGGPAGPAGRSAAQRPSTIRGGGGLPANLPKVTSTDDILASHRGNPSAFFNPNELSQIGASAAGAKIPIEIKAKYDGMIAAGADPKMAALAIMKSETGFSGGTISTRPGQMYVAQDGTLVKALLQSDQFGGVQEIDPRTMQPIAQDLVPFVPGDFRLETDKDGVVRAIRVSQVSSGQPPSVSNLGPIGKPQIPPPGGPIVTTFGPNGEPSLGRADRTGTDIKPMNVVTPPPPGSNEAPTRTPAVKFELPKPLSAQAEGALQSTGVVEGVAKQALDLIDQLKAQGYGDKQPISQDIYTKIYQMGWQNSNAMEDQLIQLLGVAQVNGMKTYMGGRPNMKLMDIIQMHLPEPNESLELSRRKLTELQDIISTVKSAIYKAGSTYREFPWEQKKADSTAASDKAGGVPNPPKANPFRQKNSNAVPGR
jgi:hypothetical protein